MEENKPEVWQRGPVAGIIPLLQPVAHAILQAREDVEVMMQYFPEPLLWVRPAGMAAAAFHLQHMGGVLSRLTTYAKGEALTAEQLQYLQAEGKENASQSLSSLMAVFIRQTDEALSYLATVHDEDLLQARGIGRKQLPSNVIGLLFHAAEHVQRHAGQLLVTVAVLKHG